MRQIHIALLQETLHRNTDPYITGYTHYTCKCQDCRGIITYLRNDIQGEVKAISTDQRTDIQKATIWFQGKKYEIFNTYNPPTNNCNFDHLDRVQYSKTVIAGDFNGHSPQWGYQNYNNTGKAIEELSNTTNLCIVQNKLTTPTLFHRAHKTHSRPDLTMLSSDLLQTYKSEVLDSIGSDHRPILTMLTTPSQTIYRRRTRWNFKKANWDLYKTKSDELLTNIPQNSSTEEYCDLITKGILKAASLYIPRGCRKRYRPFWDDNIEQAIKNREAARKILEKDPTIQNKIHLNQTTAKAKRAIKTAKKNKWVQTTTKLDLRKDGSKAWSLLSNLCGERRKCNPQPIYSENEKIGDDQKKAEVLNKHFASINKANKKTSSDKVCINSLKNKEKASNASIALFEEALTLTELNRAMKKLKSHKAPGPDKIHNEMLTNLGPKGKNVILQLINRTWDKSEIPKTWRNATIIPILKKGKPAEDVKSYRPISLTSCIGKLAERMINNRLYWWLETTNTLNKYQAGFRAGQRTDDQLFRLSQSISNGFQDKKHTTAVFVDLQQAYDRVWRKGLFWKLNDAGVHGKLYKWLKSFLTDRTIQTKLNNAMSSKRVLEEGLPQGSSLSCTLFLMFINDLPEELQAEKALYADDLVMWHTCHHIGISARRLNEDLSKLALYCERWKMKVNNTKTVYSIFTKSQKIAKQSITLQLQGTPLQKEENPVYLGVQFDRQLSFKKHTQNLKEKTMKRLNLVKRLTGTTWGSDKTTLRRLYLGYVRSVMEYSTVIQAPCSKTVLDSIEKVQSQAVHLISGGLRSTPKAACEIHTNIEPLNLRREAAVIQMVERYRRLDKQHPNRQIVEKWTPHKRIKHKSILDIAFKIEEKHHLPTNRENLIVMNKDVPPNKHLHPVSIVTNLINNKEKDSPDPLDTIASYPEDTIKVYVDGAAFKGALHAGYGVQIKYPDGTCNELCGPCGGACSIFEAETFAIEAAIHHLTAVLTVYPTKRKDVVVFSDCRSVLQAVERQNLTTGAVKSLILKMDTFIDTCDVGVTLQWIPGHNKILENERADTLAKQGTHYEQPNIPASFDTAKQIIKTNIQEEWLNGWALGSTGRCVFTHMPTPDKKDPINALERHEQVTIFRLRTGHIQLNSHLNRINPEKTATCPLCEHPNETVTHHLLHCTALTDLRNIYLPKTPNLSNTLYSDHEQLRRTCSFFTIASSRRKNIQMAAGSE